MSRLLENARRLLDAASDAAAAGCEPGDYTVYVGAHGGLELVADSDASLDSFRWSHGATAAWRITRRGAAVRVDGIDHLERIQLERNSPRDAARRLLTRPL